MSTYEGSLWEPAVIASVSKSTKAGKPKVELELLLEDNTSIKDTFVIGDPFTECHYVQIRKVFGGLPVEGQKILVKLTKTRDKVFHKGYKRYNKDS